MVVAVEDSDESVRQQLRSDGALLPLRGTRLMAPLRRPGLIVVDAGDDRQQAAASIVKNPNSVIGPAATVVIPSGFPDGVWARPELGVVISRDCHNVDPDVAMDCIGGYTIVADITATMGKGQTVESEATIRLGKQLPTFFPMGPFFVDRDAMSALSWFEVTVRRNASIVRQSEIEFAALSIAARLAEYARYYAFRAGDIVTAGIPAGPRRLWLQPADKIEIEVTGLGTLAFDVVQGN